MTDCFHLIVDWNRFLIPSLLMIMVLIINAFSITNINIKTCLYILNFDISLEITFTISETFATVLLI